MLHATLCSLAAPSPTIHRNGVLEIRVEATLGSFRIIQHLDSLSTFTRPSDSSCHVDGLKNLHGTSCEQRDDINFCASTYFLATPSNKCPQSDIWRKHRVDPQDQFTTTLNITSTCILSVPSNWFNALNNIGHARRNHTTPCISTTERLLQNCPYIPLSMDNTLQSTPNLWYLFAFKSNSFEPLKPC
eukprot:c17805_g1_i1 orf=134-694(+)